jgi:hypothetical protein
MEGGFARAFEEDAVGTEAAVRVGVRRRAAGFARNACQQDVDVDVIVSITSSECESRLSGSGSVLR